MRHNDTCAVPRLTGDENAPDGGEFAEFAALLRQLGSPDGSPELPPPGLPAGGISSAAGLRDFLEDYQARILGPWEMPAIARAHFLAARGHVRELIALDRELDTGPLQPAFASASRRIGRAQLERLRPLRDERTVQRYLAAVEAGQAAGWHTVVYGLTLAVYSWPLRSGLLTYGRETLAGLGRAAGRSGGLPEDDCRQILDPLFLRLPATVKQTMAECAEKGAAGMEDGTLAMGG